MSLTEEEKQKIIEQEEYRLKVKEQEAYRSQLQKPSSPPKKGGIGLFGLLIIFAVVILVFGLIMSATDKPSDQLVEIPNVPIKTNNINLNAKINTPRQTFIKALKGYTFKKEPELIQGQENYVAKNSVSEIQLLGSSDNLNSASFTVYLTKGTSEERLSAMKTMSLFGNSVDMECDDWFTDQLIKEDDKTKIYSNTEIACGRKLSFYYYPGDTFTFGIEPQ